MTRDEAVSQLRWAAVECSDAQWWALIRLFILEPTVVSTPMDLMPLGEIDMELSDRSGPGAVDLLLADPSTNPRCPDWDEVRALERELARPVR